MRRWGHEVDWVWQRAKLVAQDNDPLRVERLARLRLVYAQWRRWEARLCADALALHLLPKVGEAWMPKGPQVAVMTPGTTEKHSLAGALELATGTVYPGVGPRQTHALFRVLLQALDAAYPAAQYRRIDGVVDNYKI